MEIHQPTHIAFPDRRDPQAWERAPIVYEEWARFVLPQLGFSEEAVNNFVLGHVVGTILYDDGNCFTAGVNDQDQDWYHEIASDLQRQFITRLTWEIGSGILPGEISLKLSELLDYVNANDWNDYANMIESSARWRYVRMKLETRIYKGGDLEEVYTHFLRTNKMVQDFWGEFIKSRL
jgi:hypothetical protein